MNTTIRDTTAIAISVVAIAIGSLAVLAQRIEPGLDLQRQPDGTVIVSAVWPGGQAYRNGVTVGMHVLYIGDPLEDGSFPEGAGPPQGELDPAPTGPYYLAGPTLGDVSAQVFSEDRPFQLTRAGGDIAWAVIALLLACWVRLRPTLVPAADPELVRRLILPAAATLVVPVALGPAYLAGTHIGLWSLVMVPALGAWPLVDAASTLTARRPRRIATIMLLGAATSWLAGLTIWATFASLGPILGLLLVFAAVFVPISAAILAPDPPLAADLEGRLQGAIRSFDLLLVLGAAVAGIVALALSACRSRVIGPTSPWSGSSSWASGWWWCPSSWPRAGRVRPVTPPSTRSRRSGSGSPERSTTTSSRSSRCWFAGSTRPRITRVRGSLATPPVDCARSPVTLACPCSMTWEWLPLSTGWSSG